MTSAGWFLWECRWSSSPWFHVCLHSWMSVSQVLPWKDSHLTSLPAITTTSFWLHSFHISLLPVALSGKIPSQGSVANTINLHLPSFHSSLFHVIFSLVFLPLSLCFILYCFSLFIIVDHFLIIGKFLEFFEWKFTSMTTGPQSGSGAFSIIQLFRIKRTRDLYKSMWEGKSIPEHFLLQRSEVWRFQSFVNTKYSCSITN